MPLHAPLPTPMSSVAQLVSFNDNTVSFVELKLPSLWTPDAMRPRCYICLKNFGTFRRKHHCRICGEVVCASCVSLKAVHVDPVLVKGQAMQVKACLWCPTRTRRCRPQSLPSPVVRPTEVASLCETPRLSFFTPRWSSKRLKTSSVWEKVHT
ncbi:hypothetical protein Ae201684P_018738 [Aphanomyces euteiches]|uniref:FYVE-type domain-containing protein n=1 Tax=Aphanomyces euteiches TaxID=100861 RepID=A0A6G0XW42_9STRA|nr:hypothetical protein Ae201684_001128 [Aphanomyces euteiches]KAH9099727.1 hypothetical protein Ae201684P_018738 [Aphanomyces euteiches]KAH9144926.1 hypothetical protein AeRB84_011145 [Aphanomyces euteiches]